MDELSENFSKEIENTKKNQSELKNTIAEMKTTLQGINSRLDDNRRMDNEFGRQNSGNHPIRIEKKNF